jgi:glutaminyl-tRNA synthetase
LSCRYAKRPRSSRRAGANFLDALNPDSKKITQAYVEPGAGDVAPETRLQFERHGYFVADRVDSKPGKPVFNRIVGLRDSWGKPA